MAPPDAPRRARARQALSSLRRELLTVGPHGHAHWPAIRVGLSVTVPLVACLALGHPGWTPFATFGAMCSVYGKQLDYAARARLQAGTGLALVAAVVAGTAAGVVAPGSLLAVATMAVFSALGCVLARVLGWSPVPSLFLVFAVGTLSSYAHPASDLVPAVVLPTAAAALAVALGQVGRWLPTSRRPRVPAPAPSPLRAALASRTVVVDVAVHAAAPLAAGAIALAAGLGHPYWAAVTATVPLVGPTPVARVGRAAQRVAGTLLGVLVAAAILAGDPSPWVLVAWVAALQVVTELFVARHYGIAVVAITPMALVLSWLGGGPTTLDRLVVDRVVETVLGAAVGVLVLALARLLDPPRRRAATGRAAVPG
ncbi:FUSC family protein [Cellulomonas algicola]|uniref:FUSC family protein n=1 Tax=Cellulomonas algicola TaxID=2071633 RepID=UPI001C3F5BF0|nr:FUSC family protein [Cellulomonas algicola]